MDFASVQKTASQLLIRSIRFMQVELPLWYIRVTPQQIEQAMSKADIYRVISFQEVDNERSRY